jgi:tetratricopeptide (TPR) repeat protein
MNRKAFLLICILLIGMAALPIYAQDYDFNDCQNEVPVDDYDYVVEVCTAWLEINPLSIDGYFSRAYAQNHLGNYEEAIIDYSKALFLFPKDTAAFNNRGFAYAMLGQQDLAIIDYTRAMLTDPTYTLALLNRAYAYSDAGDYDSALADAAQYQELAPDDPSIYSLIGSIYIDQEQFDDARDAYEQYIDLVPGDPSGYLSRGFVYWTLDDDQNAAADYLVWVEDTAPESETIDPDDASEPFTISLEEGIHYLLALEGEAGDVLSASAVGRQETVDPVLILLDPDGVPIAMDDDSGEGIGGVDAAIDGFELPDDGEYTLIIGYAGGGANGDVRVDVRLNSGG